MVETYMVVSRIYNYFFSPSVEKTLAPGFLWNDSGPTVKFCLDTDTFDQNLKTAARYAWAAWQVGDGRYNKRKSPIAPILNDLKTHPHLTLEHAKDIRVRLDVLSNETKKKYYAPLRNLGKKLDTAIRRLEGIEAKESRVNREAFRDFMAHLSLKQQPLTSQEEISIAGYKKPNGYRSVNAALRGQSELSLENLNYAMTICSGIAKLPPYKNTVYRGAGCLPGGVKKAKVSQVYTADAFVSTAATLEAAFSSKFLISITPKHSFFDISAFADDHDNQSSNLSYFEKEVLGLPGTELRYFGEKEGAYHYEEV
ncbi:MAG: hypothetical protein VYA34_02390 [Myxococcota bacterium]|nr:hypothetical protein [Myxococcota bacterium]